MDGMTFIKLIYLFIIVFNAAAIVFNKSCKSPYERISFASGIAGLSLLSLVSNVFLILTDAMQTKHGDLLSYGSLLLVFCIVTINSIYSVVRITIYKLKEG